MKKLIKEYPELKRLFELSNLHECGLTTESFSKDENKSNFRSLNVTPTHWCNLLKNGS